MDNCKFFVESKADEKFIKDYCKEVFGKDLSVSHFDTLGSWSGYKTGGLPKSSILKNRDNGSKTVLIIDADKDFKARQMEIIEDFNNFKVPVEIFLFPNDSDAGNLESLLAEIAVKRKLMECFLEYENCVTGHPKPLNHSRIYAYLDMLYYPNYMDDEKNDLRREEFRNYRNKEHWNLSHAYLNPLKEFLAKYLN